MSHPDSDDTSESTPTGSPCCAAPRSSGDGASSGGSGPLPTAPAADARSLDGMTHLEGGTFLMGTDSDLGYPADGEGPVREVTLDPFYIDETAVTNADFREFVRDTGYETDAERIGWSFVFHTFLPEKEAKWAERSQTAPWWCGIKDACWKWPFGRGSHVGDRLDHPVVHISWNDARAYAEWAGKRLPTEAEWEYAARGGLEQKTYPWGDELTPNGEHRCNIWQGDFPHENTAEDGFRYTAPVETYPPNGYGLYQMVGNAWEWCQDWFDPDVATKDDRVNPTGPADGDARVIRGGSYLCHDSYCNRYRVAARTANTPASSSGNLGLRCVCDT